MHRVSLILYTSAQNGLLLCHDRTPLGIETGYFHEDGPLYDIFRLPVWRRRSACEAGVVLTSGRPKICSCSDIRRVVLILVRLCIGTVLVKDGLHTGGWIKLGAGQGILISLVNPNSRRGGGNDSVSSIQASLYYCLPAALRFGTALEGY